MKAFVDNLDGQGFVDYTDWLVAESPLRIERVLNQPSTCCMNVYLQGGAAVTPVLRGRMVVVADDGSALFTGYVTGVMAESEGPEAWTVVRASSDEVLADRAGGVSGCGALGGTLAATLQRTAQHQGAGLVDASGVIAPQALGILQQDNDGTFSQSVRALVEAGDAAYRVMGGSLDVQPVGATIHSLTDAVATHYKAAPAAVNDVTVSGDVEPSTYVTEMFRGDGATATFQLAEAPFRASDSVVVEDAFTTAAPDAQIWTVSDPASCMANGGAGLVLNGGDGVDGHAFLMANADVESGGSLVAEASSVLLSGASDGVLCGMYSGGMTTAHCVAGIRIRQSGGVTVAFALVNGVETGAAFLVEEGHRYTFRVRMHAKEVHRLRQTYRVHADGSTLSFGGGEVPSSGRVVCDVQDLGLSSSAAATVLCDAEIAAVPAVVQFAAVSVAQMFGSVRRVRLVNAPVAEMHIRDVNGAERPGLIGRSGEGVDASLSGSGALTFFDGRVPAPGENVVIRYRSRSRSVGRAQDADAIAAADALGLPGRAQWRGKMQRPATRSSEDCENAAAALLATGSHPDGGLTAACELLNPHQSRDVWPGDAVNLGNAERARAGLIRSVTIRDTNSLPEAILYELDVANEWAEPLAIHTTEGLHSDARVPEAASQTNAWIDNLSALVVVAVTESAIQIDAGVDPPVNGGFEVRRWDAGFGATSGPDADLVMRSPVRGFDIPREAQQEMYYLRMYDGPAPRRYSRFSAAVRVTVPLA